MSDDEDETDDSFVGSQRQPAAATRTAAGAKQAVINELSYFNAVEGCPPPD